MLAIAAFWGLLVGPYNAELFVGAWFERELSNSVAEPN